MVVQVNLHFIILYVYLNNLRLNKYLGIDTIPLFSLIQNPNVTEVYIICYGSALTSGGGNDLPFPLIDIKLLKNAIATVEDMRVDLFNGGKFNSLIFVEFLLNFCKAIEDAMDSRLVAYTYIPSLNQTVSLIDVVMSFNHFIVWSSRV
jgi:hypothetical protein